MDSAKQFASQNKTIIFNILYITIGLFVVYYVYVFLTAGSDLEISLMDSEVDASQENIIFLPTNQSPDLRVKNGGVYTISFWMLINNWDYKSGLVKSVLQIGDYNLPENYLLTTLLYPNEAKLMVRVFTDSNQGTDYTNVEESKKLLSGGGGIDLFTPSGSLPICDIQDIELQKWLNITISVNGRILDVYYDGKLTRSCVLPGVGQASAAGKQYVVYGRNGGFSGSMSGIQFFGYNLTPDRIYSIYQAGPQAPGSFLSYMAAKLGLKVKYTGYSSFNPATSIDRTMSI